MVKRHFSTSTADVNAIIMYCIACQTGSLCGGSLLQPRLSLYGCSAGGDCSVVIYIPRRRKEKIYIYCSDLWEISGKVQKIFFFSYRCIGKILPSVEARLEQCAVIYRLLLFTSLKLNVSKCFGYPALQCQCDVVIVT